MDPVSNTTSAAPALSGAGANSVANLGSDDFLQLLVTQLTNQDPLEPTGNQELLQQISSIREIELSSTLTRSLQALADREQLGTLSALIGQHVTANPSGDGAARQGVVVGVRFVDGQGPVLILSDGTELPTDSVRTIESAARAAESLIGAHVTGWDRSDPADAQLVEGIVTAVRSEGETEPVLELDSGNELRFRDLLAAASPVAA